MAKEKLKKQRPKQKQYRQPGIESKMIPRPEFQDPDYQGSDKLKNKVAIITGGDSGIGRAVAVAFAIKGADVVISYLDEHNDAAETKKAVESKGARCLTLSGDISTRQFCESIIKKTLQKFKRIDILVNNSAVQYPKKSIVDISDGQLEKTFKTNIFSYFYMIQTALPHMKKGACIINTASVTAYKGNEELIDYSATKGAIVSLTRSLSQQLLKKEIRVNGVAPGPIWTPLIPASFSKEKVAEFGSQAPMERVGQPKEIAPSYVFLACDDSSYMTGQILHPNGGSIING